MVSHERGGTLGAYQETLLRLAPLVERAATVVPGHGAPLSRERALAILSEDLAYVRALSQGEDPELPISRRTSTQKRVHQRNLAAV
jgi:hypothetical protein